MRKLGAVLAMLIGSSVLVGAVAATTTGATVEGAGLLKICKTWTANSLVTVNNNSNQGFEFFVSGGSYDNTAVWSQPGGCSTPITIQSGTTYTVSEQVENWYQITAIAPEPGTPGSDLSFDSTALPGYTDVSVTIPAAGDEAAVNFTDSLVTGQAEICKTDVSGDSLSGTFMFDLTNTDAEASDSGGLNYDVPVSVTIPEGGTACSPPVTVPAGEMEATEDGTNLYVIPDGVTANLSGPNGTDELIWQNNVDGGSGSWVLPQTPSNYFTSSAGYVTVVNYTDATVGLEICKYWDGDASTQPQGTATEYSFTETVISGVAGPDTAPATFDLTAGECSNPTPYRAGTTVEITEGPTPGTEAYNIADSGALSTVGSSSTPPPYPNLATRTTEVVIGAPTTGAYGSNTNSAEVDFYDGLAYPSTLKICKDAPAGSGPFTFTVSGPQYVSEYTGTSGTTVTTGWFPGEIADGSFTVTVPANECEFATPTINPNDPTSEFSLPYDSTQLVTETGTTGYAASGIALTSSFTDVSVYEGGVFTDTGTPVLSNANLGSSGGSSSVDVTMSEGSSETIVTWTNVDPPSAPTAPVTVANPGGANAGTTTAPTLPEAIAVSKAVTSLNASAHSRSLVAKYERQFVKYGKSIRTIEKAMRSLKLTKAQRAADLRLLKHLRLLRSRLAFRIVRLTL